ncbi:hypothetical protein JKF63_03562 [Porcisia hertigi]|uniref:C3H1-type domain-containing protein n=1 Tax=Porcisia hertigi TaxID=2761500 RepID=A0A836HZX6_9TRYP|nr:hypothetical protein JKF63_03562 [Porcisia hertigi]
MNSITSRRELAHAPYHATANIIAGEDLNAVEFEPLSQISGRWTEVQNCPESRGSGAAHLCGQSFNTNQRSASRLPGRVDHTSCKNVCRHFINGSCNRGSSCRFFHPGPTHRVIIPTNLRSTTQRFLTPLADLEQMNTTAPVSSPARKPPTSDPPVSFCNSPHSSR